MTIRNVLLINSLLFTTAAHPMDPTTLLASHEENLAYAAAALTSVAIPVVCVYVYEKMRTGEVKAAEYTLRRFNGSYDFELSAADKIALKKAHIVARNFAIKRSILGALSGTSIQALQILAAKAGSGTGFPDARTYSVPLLTSAFAGASFSNVDPNSDDPCIDAFRGLFLLAGVTTWIYATANSFSTMDKRL